MTLISVGWFLLKNNLKNSKNNLNKLNSLLRFKRNEEVFNKIAKPILNKEHFEALKKIKIGNINAKNTLSLFLSPSCPHCHIAYRKATELVDKNKEHLNLEICFNVNVNNLENSYILVYQTILRFYNKQNADYITALKDWHIKNMTLTDWQKKWYLINNFSKENEIIETHYQWCLTNDFNHAPVKIFNKKILPDVYELEELFYFFQE